MIKISFILVICLILLKIYDICRSIAIGRRTFRDVCRLHLTPKMRPDRAIGMLRT